MSCTQKILCLAISTSLSWSALAAPKFTQSTIKLTAVEKRAFATDLFQFIRGAGANEIRWSIGEGRPAWLTLGLDGHLSGTPATSDIKVTTFKVIASVDGAAAVADIRLEVRPEHVNYDSIIGDFEATQGSATLKLKIDDELRASTNITASAAGKAYRLNYPQALKKALNENVWTTTGNFEVSFLTGAGPVNCTFPTVLKVEPNVLGDRVDAMLVIPNRFGLTPGGQCLSTGRLEAFHSFSRVR